MKGTTIPEQMHIVNLIPPIDADDGAISSEVFSMKNAAHVDIILQFGVQGAAITVTVEECDDFTPSNSTAIVFDYYAETTALGDTLAARATATVAGISTGTTNNIFKVISIDASQLTAAYPCLRVVYTDPGSSSLVSAVAVLSGVRYQEDITATAIV